MLDTGECPQCQASIKSNDEMTTYFCSENRAHFELIIKFHGGERLDAILNGKQIDEKELQEIEW